jgi:hypothetical protein
MYSSLTGMVPGVLFFLVKYLLHIAPECFTRTAATATVKRDQIIASVPEHNKNLLPVFLTRIGIHADPDTATHPQ